MVRRPCAEVTAPMPMAVGPLPIRERTQSWPHWLALAEVERPLQVDCVEKRSSDDGL
ncbi:hypothethical protein (plasmid) [Ralstonia solanacearum PSI07]|nr:hypothethical protein [Ralstonia solanacearum PSI07]